MSDKEDDNVIKFHNQETRDLHELGLHYDTISQAALNIGLSAPDIAIIMANRVGEILRTYKGADRDGIIQVCMTTLKKKAYQND